MNHTAVEDLLMREAEITNALVGSETAYRAVEGGAKDWRMWGRDRTKDLVVSVWLAGPRAGGKVARFAQGAVTLKLQTKKAGDDAWTDLATLAGRGAATLDDDGRIASIPLAGLPLKQFVRLVAQVTTQWLVGTEATAPRLTAGLDNDASFGVDADLVETRADNPAAR